MSNGFARKRRVCLSALVAGVVGIVLMFATVGSTTYAATTTTSAQKTTHRTATQPAPAVAPVTAAPTPTSVATARTNLAQPAAPPSTTTPKSSPPTLSGEDTIAVGLVKHLWGEIDRLVMRMPGNGFTADQRRMPAIDTKAVSPADCTWGNEVSPLYGKTLDSLRYCNGRVHVYTHAFLHAYGVEQQRAVIAAYLFRAFEHVNESQYMTNDSDSLGKLQGYITQGVMANGTVEEDTWVVVTTASIKSGGKGTTASGYNSVMNGQ